MRSFSNQTIPLFERLKNEEFILLYSSVTQGELENAPNYVKELVKSLKVDYTEYIDINDYAIDLANEYISENLLD
jgi:hypothetical protein